MKKTRILLSLATLLATGLLSLSAQVPQLIQFQGRIAVGTHNFEGSGQFKFALVNADGSTTYWSNDGSSSNGGEPATAVSLSVVKGLYSVLLGDANLPNMTLVPNSVFNHGDVHLRVWFNDGVNGFHLLTPDQRIAAVGYAMMAANVPDGSISSAKIAPGAVGVAQLAPDAVVGSIDAAGLGLVPSGGVILSDQENDPTLIHAGYVKVSGAISNFPWKELAEPDIARFENVTALWTGSEILYWGGMDLLEGIQINSGERYTPATNTWTRMSEEGAPSPRMFHQGLWTGSKMIIWGGDDDTGTTNTGAIYQPATDTWSEMSTEDAPLVQFPQVFWTGSSMLVWGGWDLLEGIPVNTGALYDPQTNAWTATSTADAPSARETPVVLWTGTEMVVWGGFDPDGLPDDTGARYNPSTNTWSAMSSTNAPTLYYGDDSKPVVFWTGTEMLLWGLSGWDDDLGINLYAGGRYNPATNTWTAMSKEGAPEPTHFDSYDYTPKTAWTGTEMILWFGKDNHGGARYNPATDTWSPISLTRAPDHASSAARTIWTGSELLIWGGWFNESGDYNGGSRYQPATDTWEKISTTNAPFAYEPPTVVWTGSQMIVLANVDEMFGDRMEPPYSYTPSGSDFFYIYQRP